MTVGQIVFGGVLIAGLLAAALGFGVVQVLALRRLRAQAALPDEERVFERRKAWRRLVGCGLLAVMAGLLGLALVSEGPAQEFADQRAKFAAGEAPPFTDAERLFLRIWGGTWVALLAVLFVLLMLTAYDLFVSRSYTLRQMRRLQADRRAMISRQAQRMRQERGGG